MAVTILGVFFPRAFVRRRIGDLPEAQREVLVSRELEGLSYQEIATIVGIPIGTVMSRLARGRERLLAILGPVVVKEGHRDVS